MTFESGKIELKTARAQMQRRGETQCQSRTTSRSCYPGNGMSLPRQRHQIHGAILNRVRFLVALSCEFGLGHLRRLNCPYQQKFFCLLSTGYEEKRGEKVIRVDRESQMKNPLQNRANISV